MRDVYAVFGTLLAFGIAFPGWMFAWWLLFPKWVNSAETHLTTKPIRCLIRGTVTLLLIGIPTLLLATVPLPFAQLAAATIGLILTAIAAIGAAALILKLANQLIIHSPTLTKPRAFIAAAVALELAAIFPLIGWLLVVPITTLTSLGAAIYILSPFRRRTTQPATLTIELPN